MKIRIAGLILLVLLIVTSEVWAKKQPIHPFNLPTTVSMSGAEIPPGLYYLTLESTKSGVRMTLWKDDKFVATASGTWVKSGIRYREDAALLRVNSDGSRSLIEVRFAGVARAIVLNSPEPAVRVNARKLPSAPLQEDAEQGDSSSPKTQDSNGFRPIDSPAAGR